MPVASQPLPPRVVAAVIACALVAGAASAQTIPDFDRDIRPLLADRCYPCHGPDAAHREAGLRLDDLAVARAVLPSGRVAVVPGDATASELVRRIESTDPKVAMPPPTAKLGLSDDERALLRAWIAGGAPDALHWSFRPLPATVAIPSVPDPAWVRNPLDAFVAARAAVARVTPTPPASRERLIRRVTLALTGLPPTPEETAAFVADPSPDAYEQVVDRVLGSVRYAEHMALEWLDAARYADTYGYQSDVHRDVWPWRDWVIRAFDTNLPYDEFLLWQLAGDRLTDATRDQQLATAFLRLHRQTNEGGSVEEEFRVEYVADRVETIGTAMLGLTLGCAKCHDHKFDPITQRDYYALFALFDDADECGLYSHFTNAVPTPTLWLPTPEQERALAAADAEVVAGERRLRDAEQGRAAEFDAWLAAQTAMPLPPGPVGAFGFEAIAADGTLDNGATPELRGRTSDRPTLTRGVVGEALALDGEDNASFPKVADFTRDDPFTIACWVRVAEHHDRAVVWHRSRAWTDAGSRGYELLLEDGRPSFALIHFWPGNAVRIVAQRALDVGRFTHVAVTSDGSGRAEGLALFVDGERVAADVVRDKLTRDITGGGADALTLGQRFRDKGLRGGAVDELVVFARVVAPIEVRELAAPGALATAFAARDRDALHALWLAAFDPVAGEVRAALRDARRARTAVTNGIREIMTMRDDCPESRVAYRLERGQYDVRREPVAPGVPASLPPWPAGLAHDRLGFARWLVAPDHPLTARVYVNRVWQMHFGRGLAATPEDLGSQGSPPTHPELLDWLARWFVDHRYDVKALHRLIVTSATYRQDSAADPQLVERDPLDELHARGPRFRLAAEAIRDQALAVAGLLVPDVGGPSVKPYQPPGLWEEKSGAAYTPDRGPGSWRRSLYTYWKRTSPPPSMMTFDAVSREVCAVRRQTTSSPLQALVLMNDPQFVESARVLAARVLQDADAEPARIERLFRLVLGRSPSAAESALAHDALADERAAFAAAPAEATALVAVGDAPRDPAADVGELAAWTTLASIVIASDEALTIR